METVSAFKAPDMFSLWLILEWQLWAACESFYPHHTCRWPLLWASPFGSLSLKHHFTSARYPALMWAFVLNRNEPKRQGGKLVWGCFLGPLPVHGHRPPAGEAPQEEGAFWNLCALQSTLDPSRQRISCRERVPPRPPATLEREGSRMCLCGHLPVLLSIFVS